jgi:hypothetical protein
MKVASFVNWLAILSVSLHLRPDIDLSGIRQWTDTGKMAARLKRVTGGGQVGPFDVTRA